MEQWKELKKANKYLSKEECLSKSWYMFAGVAYGWDVAQWMVRVNGAHDALSSISITAKKWGMEPHAAV